MWGTLSVAICIAVICQLSYADEFFPTLCSSNANCTAHRNSWCIEDKTVKKCGCQSKREYVKEGDHCILKNGVLERCFDKDSKCSDMNSRCQYDGGNRGVKRCQCIDGFVTVMSPTTMKYSCAKEIKTAECAECMKNGGRCYDTSNNGSKDGCQCQLSRSGADCKLSHMSVMCTATEKILCYGPPNKGINFTLGSQLYTEGYQGDVLCVAKEVKTLSTDTGNCAIGNRVLKIPLEKSKRRCGLRSIPAENDFERMETVVGLKSPDDSRYYQFTTYCAFQRKTKTKFAGMSMQRSSGNDRGVIHGGNVVAKLLDRQMNAYNINPSLRIGDKVIFHLELNNKDIYSAIKVVTAMFSTKASIDLNFNNENDRNTRQVILNGCPIKSPFNEDNMFAKVQNDSTVLMTKQGIPLFKFGSSSSLYLHLSVEICTKDIMQNCYMTNCTAMLMSGRKKRAAGDLNDNSEQIHMQMEIKEEEKGTMIGDIALSKFLIITVVLFVFITVFVIISLTVLWRMRNKNNKVVDYAPDKPQQFAMPRMQRTDMRI